VGAAGALFVSRSESLPVSASLTAIVGDVQVLQPGGIMDQT